ncbi:MAG: hypothetical protein CMB24_04980 [Euryarchaeota archaeon]|nr:hypothetical protein [Euryarchaeota archaeon]
MNSDDTSRKESPPKEPRIIKLGNFASPKLTQEFFNRENPFDEGKSKNEILINPDSWPLEPNQNSEIEILENGLLELKVLQIGSTPGVKSKIPLTLESGDYTLTVVGFAEAESTFFPWVMDSNRVRLTPTVHITTQEEPVSVKFTIIERTEIVFGVLSHRQELGDRCYISSFHISRSSHIESHSSRGNFHSVIHQEFIPHQKTTLKKTISGTRVLSEPISTPGAYALVDVIPNSIITLHIKVSVVFPSLAFLYVADAVSGNELIKRNVIFESEEGYSSGKPTELYSSLDIPSGVSQIRAGILFSTVSEPKQHEMIIHNLELTRFHSLNDVVDESYVLSLKEDSQKYELCKRQGDRVNAKLTRWDAVDGNASPHFEDWSEYMEKPWSEMDKRLGRKSIDKPGAWGYLLSMKGIFEDAIDKGHDTIAVFDDDFIFSKSFDHGLSKIIEILSDNWEILYLGASQWLWDDVALSNLPYYVPDKNTNGSFSVIYKKAVFREIIRHIECMDSPFDAGPLRKVVMGSASDKSFVVYPNIVIANLEKTGIRDSRNQNEFSKRFGWDLSQFPPGFTKWSREPTILRDEIGQEKCSKDYFVTAVTTIDRKEYLQKFVESWKKTISPNVDCMLIIADDGSSDGTLEWICSEIDIGKCRLVVIKNDGLGIARQSNSIIDFVNKMDPIPSVIFMCNDDIRFLKRGWDNAYFSAIKSSNFDHLVYFNPDWKPATHQEGSPRFEGLLSSCTAREAMGCFYTITPDLIKKIGFFDEESFPVRGHSHVDYSLRACRVEANDSQFLYDIADSNEYIGMVMREGYRRTHRTLWIYPSEC